MSTALALFTQHLLIYVLDDGLKVLNTFLGDKSYIVGYVPSKADLAVFEAVKKAPDAKKYPNAARWFKHISSYGDAEKAA
jgi:elongation factor 1-beta